MATNAVNIYQFKIALKRLKPKIWRRIQVPGDYSFWDLHVGIQDVMGWSDCHLHQFHIIDPETGKKCTISTPHPTDFHVVTDERKAKIAKYFLATKDKADYEYDFGDTWEHEVLLEKILPAKIGVKYPQCLAGKNACPPEDPEPEEYTESMEELDDEVVPEEFDPKLVKFDDPEKRWKRALC